MEEGVRFVDVSLLAFTGEIGPITRISYELQLVCKNKLVADRCCRTSLETIVSNKMNTTAVATETEGTSNSFFLQFEGRKRVRGTLLFSSR